MGIKAVIDTNVLVSSFISKNPNSPTVRIIKAIIEGVFTPVYSDDILSEYEEVLGRGRFKLDPAAISILIQRIKWSHPPNSVKLLAFKTRVKDAKKKTSRTKANVA